MTLPLPFTCQHETYTAGEVNAHGNRAPGWSGPVAVSCVWWSPSSSEPHEPAGDRVTVDVVLVVDSALVVDHRDRFVIDGRRFDVVGLPKDYEHGPFGYSPKRRVIELKWAG